MEYHSSRGISSAIYLLLLMAPKKRTRPAGGQKKAAHERDSEASWKAGQRMHKRMSQFVTLVSLVVHSDMILISLPQCMIYGDDGRAGGLEVEC